MKNEKRWMAISGASGFLFFLIANFTNVFHGSNVAAGFVQLGVNTFVFIVWGKTFLNAHGFKKFVSFFGTIVPMIMASITFWRVFIPWFFN